MFNFHILPLLTIVRWPVRAEAGISVRKLKPAASIAQGSGIFPLPPPLEIYQPAGLSQGFLTRALARLPPRCESVVCASNVSTTFATFATTAEEPAEEPPKNRKERGVIYGLKFANGGYPNAYTGSAHFIRIRVPAHMVSRRRWQRSQQPRRGGVIYRLKFGVYGGYPNLYTGSAHLHSYTGCPHGVSERQPQYMNIMMIFRGGVCILGIRSLEEKWLIPGHLQELRRTRPVVTPPYLKRA